MANLPATPSSSRDPLALVVLYDEQSKREQLVAQALIEHFLGDPRDGLDRGLWISVIPIKASVVPDLASLKAEIGSPPAVVVVALINEDNASDFQWQSFWNDLKQWLDSWSYAGIVVPVQFLPTVSSPVFAVTNQVRLKTWDRENEVDLLKTVALSCSQCLRYTLRRADPKYVGFSDSQVDRSKDQIFISHSKHDEENAGEKTAVRIQRALSSRSDVSIFFDVANIRAGENFEEKILEEVAESLLIAVHTDTYSSREWCRKEVLAAKRHERPAVVAGCVKDIDRRSFPYLGNTPYVALASLSPKRMNEFVLRVFDEMLAHYVWLARVASVPSSASTYFLSRAPELITLASTLLNVSPSTATTIVYPDPPIGEEEKRLIEALRNDLVLLSYTEWKAV